MTAFTDNVGARKSASRKFARFGRKALGMLLAVTLVANLFAAYAVGTDGIFSAAAATYSYPPSNTNATTYVPTVKDNSVVGAYGENFASKGDWNFNFETKDRKWSLSGGASYRHIDEENGKLTHNKMSTTAFNEAHELFKPQKGNNNSENGLWGAVSNGNYMLQLRPKNNGNKAVTVTQTISGLDPRYTYRIGAYVKSIGNGTAYMMAGAPSMSAADADEDAITYINSNLSTWGNGLHEYADGMGNNGDGWRAWSTQQWHYSTVYAKPDASGKVKITFYAYADAATDTANKNAYGQNYNVFVDNLDIRVYKAPTATAMHVDVKYYDYSYMQKELARFFEFTWAAEQDKNGNFTGGHNALDQGLVNGVLDDNGNIVFVDGRSLQKYNVEEVGPINTTKDKYLAYNDDPKDSYKITADLLNGKVAGVPGLFRGEAIDSTLTFYEQADGSYIFDSSLVGHMSDCSAHGYQYFGDDGGFVGGFFPLCDTCLSAEGINHNFHFGMTIESPFLVDYDAHPNGTDYTLEFAGDDDFWLFIDGVLVLDGGGLHLPLEEVSMNLNTNAITITEHAQTKPTINGNIYETVKANLQKAYGNNNAAINEKLIQLFGTANGNRDTKLAEGYHTFKVFYMERCTEASDIALILNLGMESISGIKKGWVLDANNNRTDSKLVYVGDTVEYEFEITNSGDPSLGNVTFSDTLPTGLELVSSNGIKVEKVLADGTVQSVPANRYNITTSAAGFSGYFTTMEKRETIRLTFRAKVTDAAVDVLKVKNVAQVEENDVPSDEFEVVPNLTVTKDVISTASEYKPGDWASYSATFENDSTTALQNILVTDSRSNIVWPDPLPEGFVWQDGKLYITSLVKGSPRTITYDYLVTEEDYQLAKSNNGQHVNVISGSTTYKDKPVYDEDDAVINMGAPATGISIDKTVAYTQDGSYGENVVVAAGDTVWFKLVVSNDSDVTLKNVEVRDEVAGFVTTIDSIAAHTTAESIYVEYTVPDNASARIYNVAVASAEYDGQKLTGTDDATVDIFDLAIEKTVNAGSETVSYGQTAYFTITVTNTGSVALENIALTDSLVGTLTAEGDVSIDGSNATIARLEAGASQSFTFAYVATEADARAGSVTNTATATAKNPGVPDGTNYDKVTEQKTKSDNATVTVLNPTPALTIEKKASLSENGGFADNIIGAAGRTVYYEIAVTNAGDVALSGVALTDNHDVTYNGVSYAAGAVITTFDLAIGETKTFVVASTVPADYAVSQQLVNTANAAVNYYGREISVSDNAYVDFYGLTVDKTVVDIDDNAELTEAAYGSVVTFGITVTNTGSVTLANIKVADDHNGTFTVAGNASVENGAVTISSIEPGQSVTVYFDYVINAADAYAGSVKNVATGTYGDPSDPTTGVEDEDDADVDTVMPNPAIDLEKLVSTKADGEYENDVVAKPGDTVYYKFVVTNTGDTALTDVAVRDALITAGLDSDIVFAKVALAVGESAESQPVAYVIPADTDAANKLVNTATVTAKFDDREVTDKDDASVALIGLAIDKTLLGTSAAVGEVKGFNIKVTNTGSVDLTDVKITDSLTVRYNGKTYEPGEVIATVDLAVGESKTIMVEYTITEEDVIYKTKTNVAYAEVEDPNDPDEPIKVDDDAEVELITPLTEVEIVEEVSLTGNANDFHEIVAARPGDTVYFRVYVVNKSDVTLKDLNVTDKLVAELAHTIDSLGAGKSSEPVIKPYVIPADADVSEIIPNAATVTVDYNGNTLTDSDGAAVELYAINLEKTALTSSAAVGEQVAFNIRVTNTGRATLTNVEVTDSRSIYYDGIYYTAGEVFATIESLASGEYVDFTVYYNVTIADMSAGTVINKAEAVSVVFEDGEDVRTVEDDDDASVPLTGTAYSPLSIVKDIVGADAVMPGESVQFSITVTNEGAATYFNLYVQDPFLGRTWIIPTLGPNASYTILSEQTIYNVSTEALPGTYTNIAYLDNDSKFNEEDPSSYIDKDDEDFTVKNDPAVEITKVANVSVTNRNNTVIYTITVANTGNCELVNVEITDSRDVTYNGVLYPAGQVITTIDSLARGASASIEVSHVIPADAELNASYKNVATVNAKDPTDTPVTDEDDVDVTVDESAAPALQVEKWVDKSEGIPGDKVNFYFSVANTGEAPLTDIQVTDEMIATLFADPIALPVSWNAAFEALEAVSIEPGDTWFSPALPYTLPEAIDGTIFTNTVTVTAFNPNAADPTDPAERLSDSDDAKVSIKKTFALDITKDVSRSVVEPGTDVVYTIIVTNTGNATLRNVTVTDEMLQNAGCEPNDADGWPVVIDILEPNASKFFTVNYTVPYDTEVGTTIKNIAVAKAANPDFPNDTSKELVDSDDADVTVVDNIAELDDVLLEKTVSSEFALPGETVYFTITVTNNSSELLKNLVVYDPMLSELTEKRTELKAGESWTIFGETTAWTMPEDALAGSEYVNTAYLFKERQFDRTNPDLSKAIREDDAVVRTDFVPGIEITKTANVSVVNRGDVVTYTLVVTNTGNCALENVKVTDSRAVVYNGNLVAAGDVIDTTTLAVGESKSYTVTHTIPANASINKYYTNIAYVEADHPDGNTTLKDDDDVDVFVSESPKPELQVSKWVDKTSAIPGDKVNFYFSVTNTGAAALTDIEVTDVMTASTLEGEIDLPAAWETVFADLEGRELAPGEVWTSPAMQYTIPEVIDGTEFDNVVTVTAFNPNATNPDDPSERLSDSDDAQVDVKKTFSLKIVKDVNKQTAEPGDKVVFTIVVTNTGDTALEDVKVTDPMLQTAKAGSWPINVGALEPGESKSYAITYTVPYGTEVGALIKNIAYVTAPNPDFPEDEDKTLTDEDDADVKVIEDNGNDIQLDKTVNKDFANPGETVYFTITVYNNSNEDWNNLVVYDPMLGNLVVERSLLQPGETWTIVGEETAFTIPRDAEADSSYVNTAYLFKARQFNKNNPNLDRAIRKDDATVRTNYIPGVEIIKTANVAMVNRGDTVSYVLTVNNTGNCALTDVEITDTRAVTYEGTLYEAGEVITTIDVLGIDESASITVTHVIPADAKINANYKNVAEVTAPNPADGGSTNLTDDDDVDVFVSESPAPALQVEKWVDDDSAIPGDKVNFYFSVTNTGKAALSDIKVTDVMTATTLNGELELPAAWAEIFADLEGTKLAPNETWTSPAMEYTVPEVVDGTVILNVVTVTAFNPNAENPDDPAERLSDSDDAQVNINKTFALDITKDVSRELVEPGTDVVYTIIVTNTGDTALVNVEVTDPMLRAAGCGTWPYVIEKLAPGESDIITVDYTVPYGAQIGSAIDNVAYATAPNPDFPDDPSKDITVDDDAEITVIDKMDETDDIILTKTVNKSYADPGETVIFTINVYNNSDIVWKNLVVFDPMLDDLVATKDRLQPGETWSIIGQETAYMIPTDAVAGQEFVNTAYLFKARQFNEEDPDLDKAIREADASVITNFVPGVSLVKVADRTVTEPKDTVYYSILVTNTGNCELKDLVVTDTLGGKWLLDETNANVTVNANNEVVIASLEVGMGEVISYSYVVPEDAQTGDIITNTAEVTAPNPVEGGEPLTDDDVAYVTVLIPGMEVTKTAGVESALPGTEVDYTITVTNVGETTLTEIAVTDIKDVTYEGVMYPAGEAIVVIEALEPGETFVLDSVTYTIPADAAAYSVITNTATATDSKGITASGSDNVVVEKEPEPEEPSDVLDSSDYSDYSIVKTASVSTVALGESVTYVIKVSNTGSMDLANVAVTDSLPVTCNGKLYEAGEVIHTYPVLRAGETKTLIVTYDVPEDAKAGDLVNIAAMKPEGYDEKEDECIIRTYSDDQPGYKIMKVADMNNATPGTTVNFYLTVTNTGNCELTDLVVTDPILNYTYTIASLEPGATWRSAAGELTYTIPVGTENGVVFNNTAYVTGVLGTMEESNVVGVTSNSGVLGSLSTVNPSTDDDGMVATATTALGFSLAVLIATIPLMVISSKKRNSSFGN